ncbi:ABC transporter substrate-binding protein [Sphaerimonospora thailandensis]|uniref:ABC transporter substrate-binding protein n=1 Tax=Sphaerimonospora thailandensis TaxID=795644 RepID=A0A8J3R8C6_9ACTN|nr:ABC transporter substrate-binding protein [Sphaerimonospora thailandensis]GIH69279.1 ABC transporter substrate-binding protein [Sphaerimonospora thailandensis]
MTIRARAVTAILASVTVSVTVSVTTSCSTPQPTDKKLPPVNPRASSLSEGFGTMDRLVDAAKKEGTLTVVGLARNWVGYGEIISRFSDKYGIKVVSSTPDASSRQQIAMAKRLSGTKDAPDVFDLSLGVAVANAKKFAPYQVGHWTDIPDTLKDPKGLWYAAYGGYMSIGYDPRKLPAPTSYAALLRPGAQVALPGDPRRMASAFSGVMAASLQGGQADAARGVDFFSRLKKGGMLSRPDHATAVLDWDFMNSAAAARDQKSWHVTIPRGEVLASYYLQAINAEAPHPAAARLWEEFLLSDEGQNLFLRAYARPARMEAMEMRGTVDRDAAAKLPAASGTPVVLTIPQQDQAKAYLKAHWSQITGT